MKKDRSRLDYLADTADLRRLTERCALDDREGGHERQPFALAVKAGKTDRIYSAHTYHTKVPPAGIEQYIRHYTKEGDVVLDPFCGSGMTGVAATSCGRNAILVDLSPSACHIAYNHNVPLDAPALEAAWKGIRTRVRGEIKRLYGTADADGRPAVLAYMIWSDVYACASCGGEIVLWDAAAERETGKVAITFPCPHCGSQWKKTQLQLVGTRPVAKCVGRRVLPVDAADLAKIDEIDADEIRWWYPRNRMMNAPDDVVVWGDKWRRGCFPITHAADVYTKRNLRALARVWDEIGAVRDRRTRAALQFLFTSIARRDSRRTAWNGASGSSISGTLYISSISVENNILRLMDDKLPKIIRACASVRPAPGCEALVYNGSATELPLPAGSIDYVFTDPPFGGSLQYAELNFFWESWLQAFTRVEREAVIARTQQKGVAEYGRLMRKSFAEVRRVLKPGRWASVVFHSTSDEVWHAIQQAAVDAGFDIVKAVPFDKVQKTYNQAKKTKAAGFDVVMNLHKAAGARQVVSRSEEIDEIVVSAISRHLAESPQGPRTPQFLHSLAISTLLNQGVAVEKVTIPYVIDLCRTRLGESIG